MRSFFMTFCSALLSVVVAGCSAPIEEKKIPEVTIEQEVKQDAQHAAYKKSVEAGRDPAKDIATKEGTESAPKAP
jgi:hypothetical protein